MKGGQALLALNFNPDSSCPWKNALSSRLWDKHSSTGPVSTECIKKDVPMQYPMQIDRATQDASTSSLLNLKVGIWAAVLYIPDNYFFFFLIHLFGKSPSFQPEMKAWPCLGTRWGFSAPNPGWRKMLPFGPEGNMWLSIASSGECSGSLFSSKSCFWVRPLPAQLWAKQEPICRHSNPRTDCTREPCQGEFCEGQPKNWGVHSESAALSAFSGIYPKHFSRQTAKICHLKWFTMLMK